jgi:hypothetical protein
MWSSVVALIPIQKYLSYSRFPAVTYLRRSVTATSELTSAGCHLTHLASTLVGRAKSTFVWYLSKRLTSFAPTNQESAWAQWGTNLYTKKIRKNCPITVIFQKKLCMDSTRFPPIHTQHYGDYFNFWAVILWFDISDNSTKQIIFFILMHVIRTLFIDSHIFICLVSLQTALYWRGEMQSIDSTKSCILSKMLFINSTKSWFFCL